MNIAVCVKISFLDDCNKKHLTGLKAVAFVYDCLLLVTKTYHPHAEIDNSDTDTANDYMYIMLFS